MSEDLINEFKDEDDEDIDDILTDYDCVETVISPDEVNLLEVERVDNNQVIVSDYIEGIRTRRFVRRDLVQIEGTE